MSSGIGVGVDSEGGREGEGMRIRVWSIFVEEGGFWRGD